jgi:ATP-dependent Clp endopeptidase proteolytic subunit ClpP
MAGKWYAFKKSADKSGETELFVYDEIGSFGGVGAKQFIGDLKAHAGEHIHLRINSPGGEIIEGAAIFNALSRHEGGLTVHIDGLAASMASVLAMAGRPVYMADNALMMIHNPWSMAAGESRDLRKQADLLDTMKTNLVRAYQKKTGMEEKQISKLMDEETWMDALEAVALGFVDAIEEGVPAAASAKQMRSRFDNFQKAMTAKKSEVAETEITEPTVEPVIDPIVEEIAVEVEATEEPKKPERDPNAGVTPILDAAAAAQIGDLTKELVSLKQQLAEASEKIASLEKAGGLMPADVVPAVAATDAPFDPVTAFNAAAARKDSAEMAKLLAAHRATLWAARENFRGN